MPSYHFDLGDSSKGAIGFCAVVTADSKEDALRLLRGRLENHWGENSILVPHPLGWDGKSEDYVRVYFNPEAITVDDIDESVPEGWDSVGTSVAPDFTFDQVQFVADMILAGAFDRIESMLPPNIPLSQYRLLQTDIQSAIKQVKDTSAMTVAIFLAQTTGEGVGAYDWEGADVFDETVKALIEDRTRPAYKGYEPGKPCSPDCSHVARMIAEQWHNAKTAR